MLSDHRNPQIQFLLKYPRLIFAHSVLLEYLHAFERQHDTRLIETPRKSPVGGIFQRSLGSIRGLRQGWDVGQGGGEFEIRLPGVPGHPARAPYHYGFLGIENVMYLDHPLRCRFVGLDRLQRRPGKNTETTKRQKSVRHCPPPCEPVHLPENGVFGCIGCLQEQTLH